jgi:hypothetical protein
MRHEISEAIIAYHKEIDLCLSMLQVCIPAFWYAATTLTSCKLVSTEETLQWQNEVKRAQEEDHAETMEGITAILKNELMTLESVSKFRAEYMQDREEDRIRFQQLTDLLQEVKASMKLNDTKYWLWTLIPQALKIEPKDIQQRDVRRMLANVTTVTGKLPSDISLTGNGREVCITSPHAVKNGENYDIYEGEYLGQFPVSSRFKAALWIYVLTVTIRLHAR